MINAPKSKEFSQKSKPARSRSWHTGRSAFKLISQHQTSADPKSYSVWYEYVARKNKALVAAVDDILAQQRGITSIELLQVYEHHLAATRDTEEQLDDISQAIQSKVAGAKSLVTDVISSTDEYVSTMDKAKTLLPSASSPDQIFEALDEIIEQTRSSQESAQTIQVALQSTHDEITHLNSKVGQLRENLMRDPLTELINRQKFETLLAESSEDALTNGYTLTVLVVSVKNIQDLSLTAGTDISEFILKSLSGIVTKTVGDKGICARFVGAELGIMLPKSTFADAGKLAKEIIEELDHFKIVKKPSEDLVGYIQCAFGGSSFRSGLGPSEIIRLATDQATQAKFSHKSSVKFDLTNHQAA